MKDPLLHQLRQELRQSTAAPIPKAAPKKSSATDEIEVDETVLLAKAMQGVKRIVADTVAPTSQRKPNDKNAPYRRAAATAIEESNAPLSDSAALLHTVDPAAPLSYARNGVSQRTLQKLKQGQPHWQAAVDLHGCTVDSARDAVLQLLQEAQRDNLQAVKIVHGKGIHQGQALLKTYVNGWLRQLPSVLAFVSTPTQDGGTGAVYVLLKRKNTPAAPPTF